MDGFFQVRSGGIQVRAADGAVKRTDTSFNVGCLEEDSRPRKHPKDHFINLARDAADVGDSCPSNPTGGAPRACALSGQQRDLDILRDPDRSRQEFVIALLAIGHWLGDIHQPLHVSYADDAGGNGVAVSCKGNCGPRSRPKNLHSVWDNCLLEAELFERVRQRADFKASWKPRTITYRAVDSLMANTSLAQERQMVGGTPWQWAAESYAITRRPDVRYCTMLAATCRYSADAEVHSDGEPDRRERIDQAYLDAFSGTAEKRVRLAGYRLAHVLNQALDPGYAGPVARHAAGVSGSRG